MRNKINDRNNRDATLKHVKTSTDKANKWTACAPFMLSKYYHEHDCTMVGRFSMVNMKPCEKTSKYEAHVTDEFKVDINRKLNDLSRAVVNNATTELINDSNNKIIISHQLHSYDNTNQRFKSMFPSHDKRKNGKRLKFYWEA